MPIWDKSFQEMKWPSLSDETSSLLISPMFHMLICTEDTLLYLCFCVCMCGWVLRCVCCAEGEYMLTYSSVNRKRLFPHRVWRLGQSSKKNGANMHKHWLRTNSQYMCYTFWTPPLKKMFQGLINNRQQKKNSIRVHSFSCMNSHIQPNPYTKAHPDKCTPWTSLFILLKCSTGNTGYK